MPRFTRRATAFVSLAPLLNPRSARLGRIVLNPREPLETYYDLFPDPAQLDDISETHPGVNLTCTYNSNKNKSLGGALLELFSGIFSSRNEKGLTLQGETKLYQLGNAEQLFREACERDDAVKEWLQENVIKPKLDAYIIVGCHTIKNPKVMRGKFCERNTDLQAQDTVIVNAAAPGLPGVANMGGSINNYNSYQQVITATGEGIFAVQYRKVVYKLANWYQESQISLKSCQWKMMWSVRGQAASAGTYRVEAGLGDAAEFEPDSDDEDEEAEEPPDSYFEITDVSGEEMREEFILFHEEELLAASATQTHPFVFQRSNIDDPQPLDTSMQSESGINGEIQGERMEISTPPPGGNELAEREISLDNSEGSGNSDHTDSGVTAGKKRKRSSTFDRGAGEIDTTGDSSSRAGALRRRGGDGQVIQ